MARLTPSLPPKSSRDAPDAREKLATKGLRAWFGENRVLHGIDLSIPELASLPSGSTVKLTFKSNWDIEWDYDYGYVLTTVDGGKNYVSHESEKGYTTSNTDPTAGNPNQNTCQAKYDNGITGSSGSYDEQVQRAADGLRRLSEFGDKHGLYVIVDHGNGLQTLYAHLSSLAIEKGATVARGDTLGIAGATGNSRGVHLHFEVYKDGKRVDPMNYLPQE